MSPGENEKRMHVVYLPRWYPNKYDPMPGLFIERHGIAVSRHCNISVLYVHPDENMFKDDYLLEWGAHDKLPTLRIYYRKSKSWSRTWSNMANAYRFFKYHRKGLKLLRQEFGKPDLLHVHVLTRHGIIAWIHKIIHGTPYVITEHWTRYLPSTGAHGGRFHRRITSTVASHAAAIMPVTKNLRDAMIDWGLKNDNYIVIPNVVDMKMFHPAIDKVRNGKKRIVHVSCFEDKQKNISGILRVIKRLSLERQDFKCDMVGDGIHFQQLVRFGEQLGLKEDVVVFHGLKENEDLAALLRNADIMIMFSNYENLPVVILESYACGVPVISTDVGGIREHLGQELGRLVRAMDEEAFFREINNTLDHLDNFDQTKIRKYAEENFSNEVVGRQLYDVYHAVIEHK